VLEYVQAHGQITRSNVVELCGVSGQQASRLLRRMCQSGKLAARGTPPRWVFYVTP